jgi:carboxypeptidase C (cathepsin A)
MIARSIAALLLSFAVALPAFAQEVTRSETASVANNVPADSVTHHRFKSGSGEAAFTATAGTLPVTSTKGDQQAYIFYVAYTRDSAAQETRPLTFVFNGGPGASSAYLHLGAIGPRVVEFGNDGEAPALPVHLIDNPDSWLDLTDLVFVDPVGTGYSRPAGDEAGKRFYGVREDLEALASFINLYLERNARMNSPKYLVGESYGGFRAARLPELLADERRITIAGIFMISPVIEFSLLNGNEFEPLPFALRLPSYAAAHIERTQRLEPAALAEVERFALGPYLAALVATPRDPATTISINAEVARYTGLPEELVARYDSRIPPGIFTKQARRSDKQVLSRYDASVAGLDPYPESNNTRSDPVYDGLRTVLAAAVQDHFTGTLGIETNQTYRVSTGELVRQWNWRSGMRGGGGYVGAADSLREVLADNSQLRVTVAHGMTDLVTPYLTSRFVLDRLPPSLTNGRVSFNLYAGGHMMYLRAASRARLHADAAKLYPVPPL